jgi:hypothetical protein
VGKVGGGGVSATESTVVTVCKLPVPVTLKIFAFCAESICGFSTALTISIFRFSSINIIRTQRVSCHVKAGFLND